MKNRYVNYFLVLVFCLFVSPLVSYASCDDSRLAELSKIASNVQFSYSYDVVLNRPEFKVNMSNITSDIYVVDSFENVFTGFEASYGYQFINTITYDIYSNDINCQGEKLMSKSVNIPSYNKYSMYKECEDHRDLALCQVWAYYEFENDDIFYNIIKESNKIKKATDIKKDTNNNSFLDDIIDFIMSNLFVIILVFLLMFIYIILIIRRRKQ